MKIVYILLILLAILVCLYVSNINNTRENMNSAEAIQNVASVFNKNNMIVSNVKVTGDMNTSGNINTTGNINTSGQIVGNLSIKHVAGISGEPITLNSPVILNSPITYANNLKPFTLVVAIGDYKGPIYDPSGNTFPTSQYTIKIIQNGNNNATNAINNTINNVVIGVRNNKWWITQFPSWGVWTYVTLEIIPISLNDYYSSYSTHPAITQDNGWGTQNQPDLSWNTGLINSSNNSYYSFDSNGTPYAMTNTITGTS